MDNIAVEVEQKPGIIKCNFEEIKSALQAQMAAYTSLEITEDKIKETKSDLATLRKIRKAVDDQRKVVKKDFMSPYNDFENKVKDILSVIDEPIAMIDSKLKEFEDKRIAQKQEHLHRLYEESVGEFAEFLPYHMVANPKWNNATCKDSEIQFAISEAVVKVKTDISTIKMLGSEIEDELLKTYRESGNNLQAAVQKNNDYIQAKKLAEERIKKQTAESLEKAKESNTEYVVPEDASNIQENHQAVQIDSFTFKVTGVDNIQAVKDFLFLSNIDYSEV